MQRQAQKLRVRHRGLDRFEQGVLEQLVCHSCRNWLGYPCH
ncbi:MAG: hypothetical protein CTR55_03445 [Pseudomonas sp.]|nr:MAG: hypothetical protein CTR55_03445 [Pseudomonas sp.]